jgi:hypothetical protein
MPSKKNEELLPCPDPEKFIFVNYERRPLSQNGLIKSKLPGNGPAYYTP